LVDEHDAIADDTKKSGETAISWDARANAVDEYL